ncbi:hypothetical protein BJ742DRAFT_137662 [Cladochytrium replicatum]|nr:hypothetical protein BJ742DRAFT_137662 [Cladochytrium replicatum]
MGSKVAIKYPVKFFRPVAVNPWLVRRIIAVREGRKQDTIFVKETIQTVGWVFIISSDYSVETCSPSLRKCRRWSGALQHLFDDVRAPRRARRIGIPSSTSVHRRFRCWGWSILPCHTTREYSVIRGHELTFDSTKTDSLVKYALENLRAQYPADENPAGWTCTVLLRGLPHVIFKESSGFSLFFCVYENVRRRLQGLVDTSHTCSQGPKQC